MKENKKLKLFLKKHSAALSCITVLLLGLIIFSFWYHYPQTYSGHITVEGEDGEILNIQLNLNAHRSFFKPDEFGGSIFIEGQEYISTFHVENKDSDLALQKYSPFSSYAEIVALWVPYDNGNWLQNFKAKIQGEKWTPLFVLKGQEDTKNTIEIDNLSELFQKKPPEECNLIIHKSKKDYTVKEFVKGN